MARMVEVGIDSVRVSLTNQQRIVVLRESNTERYLPIWIGPYEAEAITIALQEIEVARPQTHDLLKNMMNALSGRLVRVEVVDLRDDVFFGNLVVEVNGQIVNVDSRPSDALAIAVRTHVPILVSRDVMDTAGITPEKDIQSQEPSATSSSTDAPTEDAEAEDRLSVFESFLENLEQKGSPKPPSEKEDDETDDQKPDHDDP